MNIRDYTEAARSFDTHWNGDMLHSLVHGLSSEAAEALEACLGRDTAKFLAELGDVQWELARLLDELHCRVEVMEEAEQELCPSSIPDAVALAIELVVQAGKVSALMEKRGRRNVRIRNQKLRKAALLTWMRLAWLTHVSGWDLGYVREQNIAKLSARYQGAA